MAALTTDDGFSPSGLATHLFKALPKYAVPIFIRIQPEMAITGTFKHQKVELRKQGCDPSASPDKIYWLDPKQGDYTEFTVKEYQQIMAGNAKL